MRTPNKSTAQIHRRARQAAKMLHQREFNDIARRIARRAYTATGADQLESPLSGHDICDSRTVHWPDQTEPPRVGTQLTIGWILVPPSGGSGGHTTIFRMVEALETAGHRCIIYLYERHSTPSDFHRRTIREYWPKVKASVVDIEDGLAGCDAYFATSWDTAHVLGTRGGAVPGKRFYFAQDYEPFFHARGSEYALAEDTYRFGYHAVSIGHMVADLIAPYGPVSILEFSCDTEVYKFKNRGGRTGVVLYARPDTPRRGTTLAILALKAFHERHPEQTIHVFGDVPKALPFPAQYHSRMSPTELAELYNETIAGLAMSFTNISLIVEEMLACGSIPVVNDSIYARADAPSTSVRWAAPTPSAIAEELSAAVDSPALRQNAFAAANTIRTDNWTLAQQHLLTIVQDEVYESINETSS